MTGKQREYYEEAELPRYAWQFLVHLMREEEKLVQMEWFAQGKRAIGATAFASFLEKQHHLNDSAEVQKARSMGLYEYTRQICDRLQNEHPGKAILNRCSECHC